MTAENSGQQSAVSRQHLGSNQRSAASNEKRSGRNGFAFADSGLLIADG
jgi:hypothetical protein